MNESINSIQIWRYMDLGKYVSLLSDGLFFSCYDMLGDDWEGSWGVTDVLMFQEVETQATADQMTDKWRQQSDAKTRSMQGVGISCWHRSDHESDALWKLYMPGGLGVAIQSTVEQVIKAAEEHGRRIVDRNVGYVDYRASNLGNDPIELLSYKRKEFEHEKEFRFFLTLSEEEQEAIRWWRHFEHDRRTTAHFPVKPGPLIYTLGSSPGEVLLRSGSAGVSISVDAPTLIEKVYLAPAAPAYLRRSVRTVTSQHGLPVSLVSEASIDLGAPIHRVEFHEQHQRQE